MKVEKPKSMETGCNLDEFWCSDDPRRRLVYQSGDCVSWMSELTADPTEARRIAAWFLLAAEWLEEGHEDEQGATDGRTDGRDPT